MCNAWNHRPGCTCGWGGGWHGSSGVVQRSWYELVSYATFTNPYASCPVCGATVFFYRSPHGGSVFFDSLGPPWPKHPCTDNARAAAPTSSVKSSKAPEALRKSTTYPWQEAGWQPFLLAFVFDYNPQLLRLSGTVEGSDMELYVAKAALRHIAKPREFVEGSLIQSRKTSHGDIELSLLGPDLRPIALMGYTSSIAAANARTESRQSRFSGRLQRSSAPRK